MASRLTRRDFLSAVVSAPVLGTLPGCRPGLASTDVLRVAGPNGRIEFELIWRDTLRLGYGITLDGAPVIERSALGLQLDGVSLGEGAVLERIEQYAIDETLAWRGGRSSIPNRCRGTRAFMRHVASDTSFAVEVRAFDNGIAFRYLVPGEGDRVPDEATTFAIPAGSTVWYHDFHGHYEGSHEQRRLADVPEGDWAAPPLTVGLPDERGYAAITESALIGFAGMGLQASGPGIFAARLGHSHPPSYPFTLRFGEDEAERLSRPAAIAGPIATPWRVVMVAADLHGLVNCDIVAAVAPPPDPSLFPDGPATEWLRPGRSVWKFLDGGESTLDEMKRFSRLAGELGFEYNLIEGFWQNWSEAELGELVEQSREYGVGIWLWKHRRDLVDPDERTAFFRRCRDAGVVGVKLDFFDHEAKEVIDLYQDCLRDAARFRLMVNFHGANKPAGEARTWPNEMNREGISGMERRSMEAWSRHNATLPFTRMLAGHADFTPMLFGERRRETSWPHQIATAVILSAPVLVYGAHPQQILDNPAVEVIRSIPSVWDETIVLPSSEIGELAAFARRHGLQWFIAILNGPAARRLDVRLSFLAGHVYRAALVQDRLDDPAALELSDASVTRSDSFVVDLREGGGFVARLTPL